MLARANIWVPMYPFQIVRRRIIRQRCRIMRRRTI